MISTAVALVSAALVLVPQEGAATSAEPRWPLGLRVVQVADLPDPERLSGDLGGWFGLPPVVSVVSADDGTLEIERTRRGNYGHDSLHLWLTESTLLARASHSSCVHAWRGTHLAGTACLVTDGHTAVLEFELYDGAEAEEGEALFGRLALGKEGAAMARRISALERSVDSGQLRYQQHRSPKGVSYVTSGHVDSFGRRQGLWLTRELERNAVVLEMGWRDGIPDGAWRSQNRADAESASAQGNFRMGFAHGHWMKLSRSGERSVEEWHDGTEHGTWTVYALDGRRQEQFAFDHGTPVGPLTRWGLEGLAVEESHPWAEAEAEDEDLESMFVLDPGGARFRAELAEFHTRR